MSLAVCDSVRVVRNERAPWHATFADLELRREQLREVERIEEVLEEVVNGWNAILHEGRERGGRRHAINTTQENTKYNQIPIL